MLFLAGVGAVMVATRDVGTEATLNGTDALVMQQQALAIRDVLLNSPGQAVDANGNQVDWAEDADAGHADRVQRLGLLHAARRGLDFDKLVNLRGAPYAADDSDAYVNYEEARASIGLDAHGYDFHVRAYPSLRTVQELLDQGIRDTNLKVTYIGDATGGAEAEVAATGTTPPMSTPTCAASPLDGRSLRIESVVTNNGQTDTQFHVAFDVTFGSNVFSDVQRAPLVAAGDGVAVYVDVPAAEGDCDAVTEVSATLIDPSASLVTETWTPTWAAVGAAADTWFTIDPDYEAYEASDDIVLEFAGNLQAKHGNTDGESVSIQILDGATDVTPTSISTTMTVPKSNKPWEFDAFPASELGGVGTYTVVFTRANGEAVSDIIEVTSALPSNYIPPDGDASAPTTYAYSDAAATEAAFIADLVDRFCPYEWDSQSASVAPVTWSPGTWSHRCNGAFAAHSSDKGALGHYGDVFPDDKQLLGNELHRRLAPGGTPSTSIVNTLVVGSDVDHNTMTSNAVKGAIRDWVTLAGGNLIVFGSEKQVVNWLNPIFKTKLDSSSNGLSTPDAEHPVLRVADDLSWNDFDERGRAWELRSSDGTANAFTKVVHDNSAEENAVLAISDPGAFGDGTVILTSWLPYDLFNDGTNRQGMMLVNNLLMQGYRDLFIDYGPEIPEGVQVLPADGRAQVFHPELERYITLTVRVYVFSS